MGITFELRARRKKTAGEEGVSGDGNGHVDEANGNTWANVNEEQDHERTGLLANER